MEENMVELIADIRNLSGKPSLIVCLTFNINRL